MNKMHVYFSPIRAPIYAGTITGEDVFNTLPFDNKIDMVELMLIIITYLQLNE